MPRPVGRAGGVTRRFWVLAVPLVPVAAIAVFVLLAGSAGIGSDKIVAHRDGLKAAVDAAPVATLALFVVTYFAIISSALPVGPPMSLIAGFLFGRWIGTAAILTAATAGAVVVATVARLTADTSFGRSLRAKAGRAYESGASELRTNAFGYLVVMRLVPFFPFFLVNVVAGLAHVPIRTFVLATLIGRLPAAFLYVSLGEELGQVSRVSDLASGRIGAILALLALLALLPVLVLRFRASWRPKA